jgi:hypothetical protein
MNTFITRNNKVSKRASAYFSKMHNELDLEKYKLEKYQELIKLASFQNMHDTDLAYFHIYDKCAKNAVSRQNLLNCLDEEERLLTRHPDAYNPDAYRQHVLKLISELKQQLNTGALDYLFV